MDDGGVLDGRALPPFAALRAFEAVFRVGGIRKAAASLGVNHAVVSRHLRSIEDWLGSPLIVRSGNRLELTEEGRRFHGRVSASLTELALAAREFRGLEKAGHLRLWCVPGLSIQWLSTQLADFERSHADFVVELKPTDRPADLLRHEADADIRYFRDAEPVNLAKGLRSFELARPEIVAVTSPQLAARLDHEGDPARLLDETLLHEEHQGEWKSWLQLHGVEVPGELPGQLCWHAHLAIAAARLGRGVALASEFLVGADLRNGDLVKLKMAGDEPITLGTYFLIAREDRWSLPALAALRRFLRERAQATGHRAGE